MGCSQNITSAKGRCRGIPRHSSKPGPSLRENLTYHVLLDFLLCFTSLQPPFVVVSCLLCPSFHLWSLFPRTHDFLLHERGESPWYSRNQKLCFTDNHWGKGILCVPLLLLWELPINQPLLFVFLTLIGDLSSHRAGMFFRGMKGRVHQFTRTGISKALWILTEISEC